MGRKKHIPQRSCIACREVKDKRDLVRIVRTPEQAIIIDEKGKAPGRGAYICRRRACWDKGLSKDVIGRALKTSISEEALIILRDYASALPETS